MQVLDQIESLIETIEYFKARPNSDMPWPPFVFQMPESGLVGGADDDRS